MSNLRNGPAPGLTALWFAACSTAGWVAAGLLYRVGPYAPLVGFLVVGVVAGLGLRAGTIAAIGCGIVFAIGNAGAFGPIMATQAMRGDESLFSILNLALLFVVGSYGVGAALGLLCVQPWSVRTYWGGVLGFVVGGAISALVLSVVIFEGLAHVIAFNSLELVAPLVIAPAVGGGVVASLRRPRCA